MKMNKINGMTYDKSFIIDMDGVIYKGRSLIPGAIEFVCEDCVDLWCQ